MKRASEVLLTVPRKRHKLLCTSVRYSHGGGWSRQSGYVRVAMTLGCPRSTFVPTFGWLSVEVLEVREPRMVVDVPERSNERALSGVHATITTILSMLIVALGAIYSLDLARMVGYAFFKEQYLALFFGLVLALSFMLRSARRVLDPEMAVPYWDYGAAAAALLCGIYPAIRWNWMLTMSFQRPLELVVLGTITLALLFESIRRYMGWPLVTIGVIFFCYSFLAPYMPGVFYGEPTTFPRLAVYLYSDVNALFGVPIAIVIGVVLSFVLFGRLLFTTGGGQFFTDLSQSLLGRTSGGAAKVSVIASALFGSISGSAVANVASTGSVTIPLMKKSGYTPVQAGAIEASASTGGQLMPPIMGATAFLLADFLNIPYEQVALAALTPICLYYLCILMQVHLIAQRDGVGSVENRPLSLLQNLRSNGVYLLPLIFIVFSIFALKFQPEKAAFLGIALTLVIHALKIRSIKLEFRSIIDSASSAIVEIALICAFAGVIIGILNITGLAFSLGLLLTEVGQTSVMILLILSAIMSVIMGMGMPTTAVYLLLAVLVAPALIKMGVLPLGAHLFILYMGVSSQITPPICFAAIAAASIAGAGGMKTGWAALKLSAIAFVVPFLFVYYPGLILAEDGWTNTISIVSTAIGVVGLAIALTGYGFGSLTVLARFGLTAAVIIVFYNLVPRDFTSIVLTTGAILVGFAIVVWSPRMYPAKRYIAERD